MMGGVTVQYMHQAVQLMALALLGAVNAANPNANATSAQTSTRTLNLFKSFIMSYHLLSPAPLVLFQYWVLFPIPGEQPDCSPGRTCAPGARSNP
jgi:hypothetical protein